MLPYFVYPLGLLWWVGACIRIYEQARFYQIEEYMSQRYLRWLFSARERWLPTRSSAAGFSGLLVGLFVGDTALVTAIIVFIACAITIYPQPKGEVKKDFVRTKRATRILEAAFALAFALCFAFAIVTAAIPDTELALVGMQAIGFLVWLAAPLMLVLGNIVMTPVELSIQERFKRQARQKLADINPTVIGITGSYGKTSTKHYIAHILSGKYKTFPTPKSWNTIMGVTRAINEKLEPGTQYFICEMGAYVPGEIEGISKLTKPTISIVTEVGPQHLERFKTLKNIEIAKYEIIKALPPDGVGVFNYDNPYIQNMIAKGYPNTRIAVSKALTPDDAQDAGVRFVATDISETLDGLTFTVTDCDSGESTPFETLLVGQHNVTNLLIATAVAVNQGMTLDDVAKRVKTLQPAEARLVRNVLPNGMTIINDAYSANPVGAVSSLRVLGMHDTGRRLLITPGMVELGHIHEQENFKLGEEAAKYATDVILVGAEQTRPVKEGLLAANFPQERLMVMGTVTEAIEWYQQHLGTGDTVLFLNDLPDTY